MADANRARHGRTLAERERDRLDAEQAANRLDGARLSEDDPLGQPLREANAWSVGSPASLQG